MAKELGIFALPAIMFFKAGQKEPTIYAGNLEFASIINIKIFTHICNFRGFI